MQCNSFTCLQNNILVCTFKFLHLTKQPISKKQCMPGAFFMHIKKSSIHETDIRSSLARFQLTPPVRCDQMHRLGRARGCISTHAPRVRCDGKGFISKRQTRLISTHAPRVRCDALVRVAVLYALRISTHAPRVRCDAPSLPFFSRRSPFQLTHLV